MRIQIEVAVIMPECKNCPRFEIETVSLPSENIHRCKHAHLCRTIIDLWEQKKERRSGDHGE